jgi:hypothetical protein
LPRRDAGRRARRASVSGPGADRHHSRALTDTEHWLGDLAAAADHGGTPALHPWRDTARTFYTPRVLDELGVDLNALADQIDVIARMAKEVEDKFALPPIRCLSDVQTAATIGRVLNASPGVPMHVLQSDEWNAPPPGDVPH